MIDGAIDLRLQMLDQILLDLRTLGRLDADRLHEDWITRRATERAVHVLVEIVADVCCWLVAASGHKPVATGADAVALCMQMGALSDAEAYGEMMQWRGMYVRREPEIDVKLLVTVVNDRLADFERFRDEITRYFSPDDDPST
jgi:uncharacterized protein YutE (UPF0331/DUF86 family)